jgi:hypothetical protein
MAAAAALRPHLLPPAAPHRAKTPEPLGRAFRNAEEAWFWTMAALMARREGARFERGTRAPRPCEPDDVVKCLDQLYRRRRIDLTHARILRIWGERGTAPSPAYAAERADARLWREALDRLEWPLRVKGIVGDAVRFACR